MKTATATHDAIQRRRRFEEAALPLMDYLYAKALQLTSNANDADDLVQDTFVQGLRKCHLFEEGTNLRAWLSRLQFNLFISGYRRRRSRPDGVSLVEVGDVRPGTEENPAHALEGQDPAELTANPRFFENLTQEMKHGLAELDVRYRDVLLLSTVGDKSYKDIASKLKVPVGTVMSRLSRAKAQMREFFTGSQPSLS